MRRARTQHTCPRSGIAALSLGLLLTAATPPANAQNQREETAAKARERLLPHSLDDLCDKLQQAIEDVRAYPNDHKPVNRALLALAYSAQVTNTQWLDDPRFAASSALLAQLVIEADMGNATIMQYALSITLRQPRSPQRSALILRALENSPNSDTQVWNHQLDLALTPDDLRPLLDRLATAKPEEIKRWQLALLAAVGSDTCLRTLTHLQSTLAALPDQQENSRELHEHARYAQQLVELQAIRHDPVALTDWAINLSKSRPLPAALWAWPKALALSQNGMTSPWPHAWDRLLNELNKERSLYLERAGAEPTDDFNRLFMQSRLGPWVSWADEHAVEVPQHIRDMTRFYQPEENNC